jgi:translocation and assembly module TamB
VSTPGQPTGGSGGTGGSGTGGSGTGDGDAPFVHEWARAAERSSSGDERPQRRRWPWYVLATIVLLLVAAAAFAAWIVATPSGTGWAASQARQRVPGLRIGGVQGTLVRGLVVHGLRHAPPDGGTSVAIRRVTLRLDWRALLSGTLHVTDAEVRDARIVLGDAPPDEEPAPFSLQPPIDVVVDRFVATNLVVVRDGVPVATVRRGEARGRWTGAGLEVEQLDVRAEEGAVQLRGRVAGGPIYAARADGRFRWRAGALDWSGTLTARTDGPRIRVDVALDSPLVARLDAALRQAEDWPWTFTLRVPRFDPRERLQPGGALQSLQAELHGEGTPRRASLRGRVTLNDQPLELEQLRVRRNDDGTVMLEQLTLRPFESPGRLQANGRVDTSVQPVRGELHAEWDEIVIPKALAGQVLRTRGRLEGAGSAAEWRADGTVDVGPRARLASLALRARGTGDRIVLDRFDIVQESGRLAASGLVRLAPAIAWDLAAEARSFDPGEFAASWRGDLNFDLRTQGTLREAGPDGRLALRRLEGRLRGRPLEGRADLRFAPPFRVAGTARLRSGASRVALDARAGERLDARATFAIESLDDFVPGAAGAFEGVVRAAGRWPEVAIEGRVNGRGLGVAGTSVGTLVADVAVTRPKAPSGTVRVHARDVAAAGLEFSSVRFEATGRPDAHRATLVADGDRLALALGVRGALDAERPVADGPAWRGSVERLDVRAPPVADYSLQAPARVAYVDGALQLSRSCLVDGPARVCAAAATRADGSLSAEYELSRLPLALANAVLAGRLPGELGGELAGTGNVRRDADGRWFGDASLASAEATFALAADADTPAAGERLVLYRNLEVVANLRGASAEGRVTGAIGRDGALNVQGAVSGLDSAAPRIRGTLRAELPSLAPLAPFAPQVAALDGRVGVQGSVEGTTLAPRIAGTVRGEGLTAEVPLLGLRLRDGTLAVNAPAAGPITLAASIRSGDGTVDLRGSATREGVVQATIVGENLLAADIPAARVIAAPDLRVERDAERIALTGRVTIPAATIDVQRLPQAGPQRRSPDVVVVNEPPRETDEPGAGLPLYARVEVVLGEQVELGGFGLDATLDGRLTVVERPGRRPIGSGEVRIAGQYKAYGQDLKITSGRVLFAGTPLDDPRLEIRAIRELDDDLEAGLLIRGTARNPEVSVFSDPSLGETDALAYLVTGRPMNAIGAGGTGEEGDLVQKAAQSLGTAAGGLLAKRLGKRLGIDEVGISDSEEIGGAAFTVGQYLSPRLYLGYGIGLFDPGQVITLRYALGENVSVQAVRGDETMRAGVEYRVER